MIVLAVLSWGVLLGFACGGSLARLKSLEVPRLRRMFLLGFAMAVLPLTLSRVSVYAVVVLGIALLALLLRVGGIPGIRLLAAGLLLNAVMIAAYGSMPVDAVAAELAASGTSKSGAFESPTVVGVKHTLRTTSNPLPLVLGDSLPVPSPVGAVLSLGDMLLFIGSIRVVHYGMTSCKEENQ